MYLRVYINIIVKPSKPTCTDQYLDIDVLVMQSGGTSITKPRSTQGRMLTFPGLEL